MDTTLNTKKSELYKPGTQITFILLVAVLLSVLVGGVLLFQFESSHENSIYPGVSVGGVNLEGLTMSQAVTKLTTDLSYPQTGKLIFVDGDSQWLFTPAELGYNFNIVGSASQAFKAGRDSSFVGNLGNQLAIRQSGLNIDPTVIYDQSKAYSVLQSIAQQVNRPVVEAQISMNGIEANVSSGQVGRQVDIKATLRAAEAFLLTHQDGSVRLVVEETQPAIMDVQSTATLVKQILSQPLTLSAPEGSPSSGPWTIEPQDLAKLLIFERKQNGETSDYVVSLNRQALVNYLGSLAPTLRVEPVNARMIFNEDTKQLEVFKSAVIGQSLDVEASVNEILNKIQAGEHQVGLLIQSVDPPVKDDASAESLGIRELVAQTTSYFYGSVPERVQNIRAASGSFHGVMVAPGEVFSMAKYLTDISLENGYAEALIIVGDQTVQGVGGGVCQVSTTLFRNVFFGGFPIIERHPHAYRVGYYEQQPNGWTDSKLAGLDATVYVPLVDFKFRNDTPYWLLMETYMGDYSLTWKFYSTSDGRTIDWQTTGITNVVKPPDAVYREDPSLSMGEIKQVDWAVDGATVNITRSVYKNGSVYFSDTVNTQYTAWPDAFNYGPGTEINKP